MAEAEVITGAGEVIETGALVPLDDAMAGTLARAEISAQVATARQYPRSVSAAMKRITDLATLDEETATECIYALKRGGKPIRGPSIRLAEIIAQQWGNCRIDARVISVDRANKMLVAEGMFHDLETNSAVRATVQRRISDSKGRLYSDDMIAVTAAAACSIARRNATLAGVPKGVWRKAQEAAEQVIRGDVKTLAERRAAALAAFAHFNLSAADIYAIMHVKGEEDIGLDDLVTLRAMYAALKNNETTAEDLLRGVKPERPAHHVVEDALADTPAEGSAADVGQDSVPAAETGASDTAKGEAPAGVKEAASGGDKPAEEPAKAEAAGDPIATARERGAKARAAGMARKALPTEYRPKEREAEARAWQEGWDAAAAKPAGDAKPAPDEAEG